MARLNDPPLRSLFFDPSKLSPQLQQALQQLSRAWQQWLIQIPVTTNAASDSALLGATADETARGALQLQALSEALFAVVQPAVQQQVEEQLRALELERNIQALPDSEARALAATAGQGERPIPSELLAEMFADPARTDFRAFVLEDTHANRANYPAAAYEIGQLFWETDRTALYVVQSVTSVKQWVYVAGIYSDTLANIPLALGVNDVGFRFGVTDYSHELRWTGSAWLFAPGDDSGYMAFGKPDGSAPNGGVWGLCNGSTYAVLKGDGTTENLVTDDLTGDVFLRGGTPAGVKVALALKWAAGDKTDLANTGGSVSTASGTVKAGTGASSTFLTSATFNEGNHQHGLSDANAPMQAPDETNGGLPKRANVKVYLRR